MQEDVADTMFIQPHHPATHTERENVLKRPRSLSPVFHDASTCLSDPASWSILEEHQSISTCSHHRVWCVNILDIPRCPRRDQCCRFYSCALRKLIVRTVPIRNPSPRPGHSDRDRLSPTLSPTSTLFSDKGGRSSPSPNHPASLIPPKVYLTLRSRQILLGFVSLFSLVCVLALYNPKYSPTFSSLRPLFSSDTIDGTTAQSLQLLSQLYEDERISLLSSYDQDASEALVRTAPDALNPDFNAYIERLERFTNTYFKNSKYQDALTDSLQRMVDGHSPVVEQDMSKNIFTFDKDGRAGVPDEFQWWESRLGPQGWKIEVGDDDQMEAWFQESIGGIGDRIELSDEGEGNGKRAWEEMWHGLGRPVLKSDLLRYLMMLVKGGLYTDSDTSVSAICVISLLHG